MKTLFILDPLGKLDPIYDSSLALVKEFYRRGHSSFFCRIQDLFARENSVYGHIRQIRPKGFKKSSQPLVEGDQYSSSNLRIQDLLAFDLILIRKEPPFDLHYLYLTYLLDTLKGKVTISNDPEGIRNTSEKLACFHFSKWMPKSLVSWDAAQIRQFQNKLGKDIVLKPLNDRSGYGIVRLPYRSTGRLQKIQAMLKRLKQPVLAQEFLGTLPYRDKRVTLLNGKVLFCFEKRSIGQEFRTNLHWGAEARPAKLTASDLKLISDVRPYLRRENIHLAGLDVLDGKLIDLNVTCPGGFADAKDVYPDLLLIELWADSLEKLEKKLIDVK